MNIFVLYLESGNFIEGDDARLNGLVKMFAISFHFYNSSTFKCVPFL